MTNWRIAYLTAVVGIGAILADLLPAAAAPRATEWSSQSTQRARPRVEIRPGGLYYRECVDGLQRVNRPYWGTTVLMPYMRCWWVRR